MGEMADLLSIKKDSGQMREKKGDKDRELDDSDKEDMAQSDLGIKHNYTDSSISHLNFIQNIIK